MSRVLYSIAHWGLGSLPVDDAGRRVFDETLADWRKEAAKARGATAGALVTMRAIFAVIRCVAGVSVREAGSIHQGGLFLRVVVMIAAYLALVNLLLLFTPPVWQISPLSRMYAQASSAIFFLPVALLLAASFGGTQRHLPSLGLGLAAALVAVAALGWGLPLANRALLEANPGRVTTGSGETRLVPSKPGEGLAMAMGEWRRYGASYLPPAAFMNDVTVGHLATKIAGGPEAGGWSAIRWMSFFFAYLVTCALVPVLASLLQRRTILVRSTMIATTVALLWTQGGFNLPFGEFSFVWWLGAYWIPVVWICLCLTVLDQSQPGRLNNK